MAKDDGQYINFGRPQQSVGQRWRQLRILIGAILVTIIGVLLILAEVATKDSPTIGIIAVVVGILLFVGWAMLRKRIKETSSK